MQKSIESHWTECNKCTWLQWICLLCKWHDYIQIFARILWIYTDDMKDDNFIDNENITISKIVLTNM